MESIFLCFSAICVHKELQNLRGYLQSVWQDSERLSRARAFNTAQEDKIGFKGSKVSGEMLIVDSTGFRMSRATEYIEYRYKLRRRKKWVKL